MSHSLIPSSNTSIRLTQRVKTWRSPLIHKISFEILKKITLKLDDPVHNLIHHIQVHVQIYKTKFGKECVLVGPYFTSHNMAETFLKLHLNAGLFDCNTGYSYWDGLRNFLHKFTWIFLSVHKLNKLGTVILVDLKVSSYERSKVKLLCSLFTRFKGFIEWKIILWNSKRKGIF